MAEFNWDEWLEQKSTEPKFLYLNWNTLQDILKEKGLDYVLDAIEEKEERDGA